MTFQLKIVHPLRLADSTDGEAIAERLLLAIGYIPPGTGQRLEGGARASAGFKLFYHCLAAQPHRSWNVAELTDVVGATAATVYRHLQRLKELGLVAEEAQQRYRFWHFSRTEAWEGVLGHARICQRRYGVLINRLEGVVGGQSQTEADSGENQPGEIGDETNPLLLAQPPKAFHFTLAELPAKLETASGETAGDLLTSGFLMASGFLDERGGELIERIPYRLFSDWLLARRDRVWTADELSTALETIRTTVYRHLNRLEAMGLIEKVILKAGHPRITGFRLKGGSLTRAWQQVESQLELGLRGYRKAINQLAGLAICS